jgi:hypothetical protein
MQAMTSTKDNHSAKYLWSQVFARLAESDLAAIQDPDHDQSADEARMVEGLTNAGWKAEDIQQIGMSRRSQSRSPVWRKSIFPLLDHENKIRT